MHVLILPSWYPTPSEPVQGVFFQEQARALARKGLRIGVVWSQLRSVRTLLHDRGLFGHYFQIVAEGDEVPTLRVAGWAVPRAPKLNRRLWMAQAWRLFRFYEKEYGTPDLIHAHCAVWGGVAARLLGSDNGLPYVVTEHSTKFGRGQIPAWQRPWIRDAYARAAEVITVSRGLARSIRPHLDGREPVVIPNMVDTRFFALPRRRGDVPWDETRYRLLCVAYLTPKKGITVLLHAFARAFADEPSVTLDVGGDGEQRGELEALATDLGIGEQVRFLGMLGREQVRDAMRRAHAFVLASHIETFGVVLLEAMATGLPVIATRCGGPEEFVTPQVGRLVDPGNVAQMADALHAMRERHSVGSVPAAETVRAYVEARFSQEVVADRLCGVYRRVLEANSGRA